MVFNWQIRRSFFPSVGPGVNANIVFYKVHSLPSCPVGSVVNARVVARRT